MLEFEISKGELFCLAAILGIDELINVVYEPEGSESDINSLFSKFTDDMRKKKWLSEDFDGNVSLSSEMVEVIDLCRAANQIWLVQSHIKNKAETENVYTVYNNEKGYLLTEEIDELNYRCLLCGANEVDKIISRILMQAPFHEMDAINKNISETEIKLIKDKEDYTLLTASQYTVVNENNELSFICMDTEMFISLENSGIYRLSIEKDIGGEFIFLSLAGVQERLDNIFKIKEGN